MAGSAELLERDFATLPELLHAHAIERPDHRAIIDGERVVSYAQLDMLADRVAASLQRDGLVAGDVVAICAPSSIEYISAFVGALRAGVAAAPLSPSSTAEGLALMVRDSGAKIIFLDDDASTALDGIADKLTVKRVALEGSANPSFESWLAPAGARPAPVVIDPDMAFNIIYSSGTTGRRRGSCSLTGCGGAMCGGRRPSSTGRTRSPSSRHRSIPTRRWSA